MVYIPRKGAALEDAVTFLNAELSTNVKKEFPYVEACEFDSERRNIEAGMMQSAVYLNLRDRNADAIKYHRPRIWPAITHEGETPRENKLNGSDDQDRDNYPHP